MNIEKKKRIKSNFKFAIIIITAIFVALFAAAATCLIVQNNKQNNAQKVYCNLADSDIDALYANAEDSQLMYDESAVKKFETSCLGNENSKLLLYGNYCSRNGLVCKSNSTTTLEVNGNKTTILDSPASYINILDDNIYYRNDSDRKYYKYNVRDGSVECVINTECSQVTVSRKGIIFIDFNTSLLNLLDVNSTVNLISDTSVKSFAVFGNSYLCLTNDKMLVWISESGNFDIVDKNVDRFIYDGHLAVQKGSNIYTRNDFAGLNIALENAQGVLVGAKDGYVYLAENDCIARYEDSNSGQEKNIIATLKADEAVKAFYVLNDKYEIISYSQSSGMYKVSYTSIPFVTD